MPKYPILPFLIFFYSFVVSLWPLPPGFPDWQRERDDMCLIYFLEKQRGTSNSENGIVPKYKCRNAYINTKGLVKERVSRLIKYWGLFILCHYRAREMTQEVMTSTAGSDDWVWSLGPASCNEKTDTCKLSSDIILGYTCPYTCTQIKYS